VARRKGIDEAGGGFVPKHRPGWVANPGFPDEYLGKIKKRLIMAAKTTIQLSLEHPVFGSCERKLVGSNSDQNGRNILIGIGAGINSGRTNRQRSLMRFVTECVTRNPATDPRPRNEADDVLAQKAVEMRAATKTQAGNRNAAFPGRPAARHYCRRGPVFLGSEYVANLCQHERKAPDE
jgi:hypothetical protein